MELDQYREIAIVQAMRLRMSFTDAEDCASMFVYKLLDQQNACRLSNFDQMEHKEAWLHRCARNHALNYKRSLRRMQNRQISWRETGEEESEASSSLGKDTPLACCLHREALREALAAVDTLSEQSLFLFIAHHIDGRSLVHLARSVGKKPNAVSQAIFRARNHIRRQLERRGWTHEDFVIAIKSGIDKT